MSHTPRSSTAIDLLTRLLQFDPTKRLTAAEALNHPYFTGAPLNSNAMPPPAVPGSMAPPSYNYPHPHAQQPQPAQYVHASQAAANMYHTDPRYAQNAQYIAQAQAQQYGYVPGAPQYGQGR